MSQQQRHQNFNFCLQEGEKKFFFLDLIQQQLAEALLPNSRGSQFIKERRLQRQGGRSGHVESMKSSVEPGFSQQQPNKQGTSHDPPLWRLLGLIGKGAWMDLFRGRRQHSAREHPQPEPADGVRLF